MTSEASVEELLGDGEDVGLVDISQMNIDPYNGAHEELPWLVLVITSTVSSP
jgi:hypothetical protein